MEELFDSCDSASVGKVPVSKLIFELQKTVNMKVQEDPELAVREDILKNLHSDLDPTKQDIEIDKATWVAAWNVLTSVSPEKQEINGNVVKNMAAGDAAMRTYAESPGELNQSKESFCFSPGSRSSSVESESEEVMTLKQEKQELLNQVRLLKQRIQTQEDAMLQELSEIKEQRKKHQDLNNRLTKRNEILMEDIEELKLSLETCEKEKLDLCTASVHQNGVEKQLRMELENQQKEIAAINREIEEANITKENQRLLILDLGKELQEKTQMFLQQQMELQNAMQIIIKEKEEISSKLLSVLLDKKDLSARLEAYELELNELQPRSYPPDPPMVNLLKADSQEDESPLRSIDILSSTPVSFGSVSTQLASSFFQEMEAAGSFTFPFNESDSCNEEEKNAARSIHNQETSETCLSQSVKEDSDRLRMADSIYQIGKVINTPEVSKEMCKKKLTDQGQNFQIKEEMTESCTSSESISTIYHNNNIVGGGDISSQEGVHQETQTSIQTVNIETQTAHDQLQVDETTQTILEVNDSSMLTDGNYIFDRCEAQIASFFPSRSCDKMFKRINTGQALLSSSVDNSLTLPRPITNPDCEISSDMEIQTKEKMNYNTLEHQNFKFVAKNTSEEPALMSPLINTSMQSNITAQHTTFDVEIQTESQSAENFLDIHEMYSSQFSKKWILGYMLALTFVFISILLCATILCTAAVLETASESGVLAFPYYGSTPKWIKKILRPFVQIHPPVGPVPV